MLGLNKKDTIHKINNAYNRGYPISMQDDKLVRFFSKHLVPISITYERDGNEIVDIVTCFVLSVSGHWFLVTAGHWKEWINHRKNDGYQIIKCYLIDTLGEKPKHEEPIPFVYDDKTIIPLSEEKEFDYGIVHLSLYYRQLLEKNGIRALDEEVWKKQPSECDLYFLLGVPAMLVNQMVDSEYVRIVTTLHKVDRLEQRPKKFTETDVPLFYGQIAIGEGVTDITGMSGGPIIGLKEKEDGQFKYWLIALQSTWLSDSKYIKGCQTKILGDYLEDLINQGINHN